MPKKGKYRQKMRLKMTQIDLENNSLEFLIGNNLQRVLHLNFILHVPLKYFFVIRKRQININI